MFATGLEPRRPEHREMMASEHLFEATELVRETIIQPVAWTRNQRSKPSCVGQTFAAGIDAKLLEADPSYNGPWASAVDLWEDARRRQNRAEAGLSGTRAEYAIASLMRRGWSQYEDGEDRRPFDEDVDGRADSLFDELHGHDTRQILAVNYDISRNRVASTIAALKAGHIVGGGWGLKDKFSSVKPNTVLTPDYVDAGRNGHEMRLFAYIESRRAFAIVNSWGRSMSHFYLDGDEVREVKIPRFQTFEGSRLRFDGCLLMSEEALEVAWDIDSVEIRV